MAKDKYDFILDLINNNKMSTSQKERVLKLAVKEIGKDGLAIDERLKRIEEAFLKKDNEENHKKYKAIHNPTKITKYLKKFKENSALKFTTHNWDEKKYATIQDFIDELNEDKDFRILFNYNRNLYNLITYFIYNPNKKLNEQGIPKYGWPNFPEIKIGWQFPDNLLIDWCKKNFDSQENIKYPFEYPLPKEFRPKNPIKGKMITTFENVVDVFKTEIQFRDNYLYNELEKRSKRMNDYDFNGISRFENLDFYTYTSGVLSAIDRMLNKIKKNETAKKINFNYKIEGEQLIIDITQINSFAHRKLNKDNLLQFLGGYLNSMAEDLISLCDFSVISKFEDTNDNELNAELSILHNETEAVWERVKESKRERMELKLVTQPVLKEITEDINGFTYRLKFPI